MKGMQRKETSLRKKVLAIVTETSGFRYAEKSLSASLLFASTSMPFLFRPFRRRRIPRTPKRAGGD
ncbi:hypothetical protein, partial [Streptomyces sp. NPDC060198]|uniref:hypothetical protein n=1 Tax=Streptomyces sp. NPDC060198 TaxID=3347070 RepID=UPI00364B4AE9